MATCGSGRLQEVIFTSDASAQLWNTCVWDLYTGAVEHSFKGGVSASNTLCLVNSERLLCAEYGKPLIHHWPICRKEAKQTRIVLPGKASVVVVTPDGHYCIVAIAEKFYVWQLNTGHLLAISSSHYQQIRCMRVSADGASLYTAGDDAIICCWSIASLVDMTSPHAHGLVKPIHSITEHSLPVTDLSVSTPASRPRLLSASQDQSCRLFDTSNGKQLASYVFDSSLTRVCLDPTQCSFYAATTNGAIYKVPMHNTAKETHVTTSGCGVKLFTGHQSEVTCLCLNMDGSVLASGSKDQTVRLWNTNTMQCIRQLQHKGVITNVAICYLTTQLAQDSTSNNLNTIRGFERTKHAFASNPFGEVEISLPTAINDMDEEFAFCQEQIRALHLNLSAIPEKRNDNTSVEDEEEPESKRLKEELASVEDKLSAALSVNSQLYQFALKHIGTDEQPLAAANRMHADLKVSGNTKVDASLAKLTVANGVHSNQPGNKTKKKKVRR